MKVANLVIALLLIQSTDADWFDDLINSAHDKIVAGATYLRDTAGPGIRNKFNEIKSKLQDPETHQKAKRWLKEVREF